MDKKVTREEARNAIQTLLRWIGENPNREGLLETPDRLLKGFEEHFAGYNQDSDFILKKSFEETAGYDDIIYLTNIEFHSHCEHHIAPIIGKVHIAYAAKKRVVGISKLARIVNVFAKRLQLQERMTSQIANAIQDSLDTRGVAVIVDAHHHCISKRGARNGSAIMRTKIALGVFKEKNSLMNDFFDAINSLGNVTL